MANAIKISLIVVGLVLLFGLIGAGIYFLGIQGETAVSSPLTEYSCKANYVCTVTPMLQCDQPTYEPRIRFRTNALINSQDFKSAYENSWIVVDVNNNGELVKFANGDHHSGTSNTKCVYKGTLLTSTSGSPLLTADGYRLSFGDNKFYVYQYCSGNSYKYVVYTLTTSTVPDTTPTPKEPFTSAQQEILATGDQSVYSCSRSLLIDGKAQAPLTYNKNTPTTGNGQRFSSIVLTGSQKLTSPSGTGVLRLEYNEVYTPAPITTCTAENGKVLQNGQSICLDSYTAQKCVDPPNTQKTYAQEGQTCKNGIIAQAYNVDIKLNENVISFGEKFLVDFALTGTDNNKNVEVTATILKGSQVISSVSQLTGNSPFNAGKTQFSIDSPPIGYYTLRITFNNPDGNFKGEYNVQVTDTLSIILKTPNPIQFDNKDIVFSLESYKGGSYKSLKNYDVEATYNGMTVYPKTTQSGGLGILKFYYSLQGDGTLRIRARGNDETGLWSEWTDYLEISVRKASIIISAIDFPTDVCTGSYELEFETKDSTGNYIETSNQVTIDKSLGGTDTVSSSGSNGKYSANFNFVNGGIYVVRITSTNTDVGTSQLNAGQGQVVNILTGDACGGGGGGGGTNWTLYSIIGVAIISIVFFIYFVFFYKGRKK